MQHPLAPHPLNSGDYISDDVVAHMAHVQVPRRVGKHRKGIERLTSCSVLFGGVQAGVAPLTLPMGFKGLGLVPG